MILLHFMLFYVLSINAVIQYEKSRGVIIHTASSSEYMQQTVVLSNRIISQGMSVTIFTRDDKAYRTMNKTAANVVVVPNEHYDFSYNATTGGYVSGYRGGKIWSMQNSPYKFTLFLDTDTFPCMDINRIMDAAENLMQYHDMAGQRFACGKGHTPANPCPPLLNTGAVFYRRDAPKVQELLTEWYRLYKEGAIVFAGSPMCTEENNRNCRHVESRTLLDQYKFIAANRQVMLPILGLGVN